MLILDYRVVQLVVMYSVFETLPGLFLHAFLRWTDDLSSVYLTLRPMTAEEEEPAPLSTIWRDTIDNRWMVYLIHLSGLSHSIWGRGRGDLQKLTD